MDMGLRFWKYGHSEFLEHQITLSPDGFPVLVSASTNPLINKATYSGKYCQHVLRGELLTMPSAGFPLDYTGLHLGVVNDSPLWMLNTARRSAMAPWEYGKLNLQHMLPQPYVINTTTCATCFAHHMQALQTRPMLVVLSSFVSSRARKRHCSLSRLSSTYTCSGTALGQSISLGM